MKIQVNNRDYGFLSAQFITVYRTEDGMIVYCNHNGSEIDEYEYDDGHTEQREVCDKCEAWRAVERLDWHEDWNNAPFEGEL